VLLAVRGLFAVCRRGAVFAGMTAAVSRFGQTQAETHDGPKQNSQCDPEDGKLNGRERRKGARAGRLGVVIAPVFFVAVPVIAMSAMPVIVAVPAVAMVIVAAVRVVGMSVIMRAVRVIRMAVIVVGVSVVV